MAKILVTGGLGYIGSHTVVELVNAGYDPIIVDDLSNSKHKMLGQLSKIIGFKPAFYKFDLCDKKKLTEFARNEPGIAGIIHFAAFKAVGESVRKPLAYYHNNLLSLLNLLDVYRDSSINFVFSSSCTVYGQPD